MHNSKKAAIAFMLNYLMTIGMLFLIITFFMIYFLILGGADSQQVIIKTGEITPSLKLSTILKTNVTEINPSYPEYANQTFYNLVQSSYLEKDNEKTKKKFNDLLGPLLIKMSQISNKDIGWNLKFYENEKIPYNEITSMSVSVRGNSAANPILEEQMGNKQVVYFEETVLIPIKDKEPIIAQLYLTCISCTKKQVDAYI